MILAKWETTRNDTAFSAASFSRCCFHFSLIDLPPPPQGPQNDGAPLKSALVSLYTEHDADVCQTKLPIRFAVNQHSSRRRPPTCRQRQQQERPDSTSTGRETCARSACLLPRGRAAAAAADASTALPPQLGDLLEERGHLVGVSQSVGGVRLSGLL